MKTVSICKFAIVLMVVACAATANVVSTPEIKAEQFEQCNSKDEHHVKSTITPFSVAHSADGQKIECSAGVNGFDESGHKADEAKWDSANKRCVLFKKFCFIGKVWVQEQVIKSDGEILKEQFAKMNDTQRSLVLTNNIKEAVSKVGAEAKEELAKKQLALEEKENEEIKNRLAHERKDAADLIEKKKEEVKEHAEEAVKAKDDALLQKLVNEKENALIKEAVHETEKEGNNHDNVARTLKVLEKTQVEKKPTLADLKKEDMKEAQLEEKQV